MPLVYRVITPRLSQVVCRQLELAQQRHEDAKTFTPWRLQVTWAWTLNFLRRASIPKVRELAALIDNQKQNLQSKKHCHCHCDLCDLKFHRTDPTLGMLLVQQTSMAVKMGMGEGEIQDWMFVVPQSGKEVAWMVSKLHRPDLLVPGVYLNAILCERCERTVSLNYVGGTLNTLLGGVLVNIPFHLSSILSATLPQTEAEAERLKALPFKPDYLVIRIWGRDFAGEQKMTQTWKLLVEERERLRTLKQWIRTYLNPARSAGRGRSKAKAKQSQVSPFPNLAGIFEK